MTRKRYRIRNAPPGRLMMFYGIVERGEHPDVCVAWGGDGSTRRDGNLLLHYLQGERPRLDPSAPRKIVFDKSLIKELEERGYDLTTLKFSIDKKKEP